MTSTDPSPYFLPGGPPQPQYPLQPHNPLQPNSPFPPATSVPVPEFDPPDTDVKLADLQAEAKAAWNLADRALGGAEGGRKAITGSATEFSELISTDISTAGDYNEQEWRKACMVLTFAASIADLWHKDVTAFRKDREDLISDYRSAITAARLAHTPVLSPSAGGSGLPLNPSQPPMALPHDPHAGLRAAYMEVLARFNKKGKDLKSELLDTAGERAALLDGGPEPSNLKALVEAGVLGWGAYNVLGPEHDTPLPVSSGEAKKMAKELEAYLSGDKEPDARYHEILAAVGAVSAKAKALQEAGRATTGLPYGAVSHRPKLDEDELDFLRTFYGELEEQSPYGVVRLMPWLKGNDGPGWSEAEREQFAGAMADGLLVLSDEKVGGGQDLLPESVRNFAGGIPTMDGDHVDGRIFANDKHNWMKDARDLGDLFEHADPELRGGTEFSSNTTLALGHHLNQGDRIGGPNPEEDTSISHLLDVTTRNEEANHRILTDSAAPPWENSDNPRYRVPSMPDFGSTSDALLGLYTHDWEDGGKAAAGLTGWIPEAAEGEFGGMQRLARESAEGLIRMTAGDKDVYDALTNTGITVKEKIEVDGEKIEVEYPDAAFGRVNPELSRVFGDVALAYLDDFSSYDNSNQPKDDDGIQLGFEERQRFLQFAAAEDTTVQKLYGAAGALDLDSTHRLLGEDEQKDIAYRNSTFRALLDAAVRGDTLDRSIDMDNAEAQAAVDKKRDIAVASGLAFGVANVLPSAPGGLAIAGITAATFEFNDRVDQSVNSDNYEKAVDAGVGDDSTHAFGANKHGRTYSQVNHDYKTKLDLLDAMVRSGRIDVQQVEDVSPQLLTDDGKKVVDYYEFDKGDRTGKRDSETGISPDTALDRLLKSEKASIAFPDGTEREAHEVADQYSRAYHAGYYEVIKGLSSDIDKEDYKENASR